MSDKFETGNFVIVAGDGDEVYIIQKIDEKNKRLALNSGVWEPMKKCTVVPHDRVVRTVTYHYRGE